VWVILLPTLLALAHTQITLTVVSYAGIALWAAGVTIEATADLQKYTFSQNPKNKGAWIETGVWRYSRHPNYFGEILAWVGVYICVAPVLTPLEAWIGLIGPIFIACLLIFVSGIPPLEKHADEKWGSDPDYQAYKRSTSVLIPWRKKA
jgi:steroid 5-alpha reductase family enzyme